MTPPDLSDWTVKTLKEFVERLMTEHDRRYQERYETQQRNLEEARETISTRLEGMNQFRDQLREQAAKFASLESVGTLQGRIEKIEGHALGLGQGWQTLVSIASLVIAMAAIYVAVR